MLYVGRLPLDDSIPDSVVQRLLEAVAKPSSVHWKRASDPESGELKRFGHAEVNHPAAASRLLRLLNGFVLPLRAGDDSEAIVVKAGSKVMENLEKWQSFHKNKADGKPVTTMNPFLGCTWENPSDQEGRDASARLGIDEIMKSWRASAGLRQASSSSGGGGGEGQEGEEDGALDAGDGTVENLDDSTRSLISMFRKKTSNIDDYVKERRREVTLKERERARLLAMRRERAKQKEDERRQWREEQEKRRHEEKRQEPNEADGRRETRAADGDGHVRASGGRKSETPTSGRRNRRGGGEDDEEDDAYDAEERAWLERERRMKRRRPEASSKRPRPEESDAPAPSAKRPHIEGDASPSSSSLAAAAAGGGGAPTKAGNEGDENGKEEAAVADPKSVFAKPMPWPTVDSRGLVQSSAVPVLEAGLEDLLGVADEELMQFCLTQLQSHCKPQTLVDELEPVLEEEAAPLVRDVWQALLRAAAQ